MATVIPDKAAVATHKAGHAIVILATPIRDYILRARIFRDGEQCRGRVYMDGRDRSKVDPFGVYEFARGIAGPLAQIHFHPNSIPKSISDLIQNRAGLLHAARDIDTNQIPVDEVQWWPDLQAWIGFSRAFPALSGIDYLQVESGVRDFLKDSSTENAIRALADRLVSEETLERSALLAHLLAGVPKLALPTKSRMQ